MQGIRVNPISVREGQKIATRHQERFDGSITVIKSRPVKKVEFCPGKPECFHLDGECYDTRFSTVIIAVGA